MKNFFIVFLLTAASITSLKAAITDEPYDSERYSRSDSVQFFDRLLTRTVTDVDNHRRETRFKRYGTNFFMCAPIIAMLGSGAAAAAATLSSGTFFNGISGGLFGIAIGSGFVSLFLSPLIFKDSLLLAVADGASSYDTKKSNIVFFQWLISLIKGEPTNKGRQIYKSYLKFIKNHNKQNNTNVIPLSLEKFTDGILKLAKEPEKHRFDFRFRLDREDFFKELHGI